MHISCSGKLQLVESSLDRSLHFIRLVKKTTRLPLKLQTLRPLMLNAVRGGGNLSGELPNALTIAGCKQSNSEGYSCMECP